jgi:hypothetical protein
MIRQYMFKWSHSHWSFIVKSYDNMVHDNWLSLAFQFGEKNNLNVNYIMHFSLMYMLLKNLSLHLSQSNDFSYDCGCIWVAFRGPVLSILTLIFLWSLPLTPHNLHYHRPSMQPPFMLIGVHPKFLFSLLKLSHITKFWETWM